MKIKKRNINLYDTLFSGQCFRMTLEEDNSYTVILSDRVINIREEGEYLEVSSSNYEFLEEVLLSYFDLMHDYDSINNVLVKNKVIRDNIDKCKGYRILRQDKFEMFITYIISQNNNVKRITLIVNRLCERFGKRVEFRGKVYYLFPTYSDIKDVSVSELRNLGLGFRDEYVRNALDKLGSDSLFLERLDLLSTKDALKELMSIKGIGMKVASCILLFGYGRFMENEFGEYSGLAIQYFFHIERNKKE